MVMLKAIGALSLTVLVLGGCSRGDSSTASSSSPTDSPVAAAAASALPAPGSSGAAAPAEAAATATQPAPGSPVKTTPPQPPPSRPAGVNLPDTSHLQPGWVIGTVTGASSSCLTVKTAEGVTWSLYSAKPVPANSGDEVRARVTPGAKKANCGTGKTGTLVRLLIAAG
jgi:hypothetical protein